MQLRCAAAMLLSSSSLSLYCYHTECAGENPNPPCDDDSLMTTSPKDCAIMDIVGHPKYSPPEGNAALRYDMCLRTQLSGVVPYTTDSDDGLSYYSCGSSGGYSCDQPGSTWAGAELEEPWGAGLVVGEAAVNDTNNSVVTAEFATAGPNGTALLMRRTTRWCCNGHQCNEPTQVRPQPPPHTPTPTHTSSGPAP